MKVSSSNHLNIIVSVSGPSCIDWSLFEGPYSYVEAIGPFTLAHAALVFWLLDCKLCLELNCVLVAMLRKWNIVYFSFNFCFMNKKND